MVHNIGMPPLDMDLTPEQQRHCLEKMRRDLKVTQVLARGFPGTIGANVAAALAEVETLLARVLSA